jgi:hypothetical protein
MTVTLIIFLCNILALSSRILIINSNNQAFCPADSDLWLACPRPGPARPGVAWRGVGVLQVTRGAEVISGSGLSTINVRKYLFVWC